MPRALDADLGEEREVAVPVPADGTLAGPLDVLRTSRPALERRVRDETGALRRCVDVYAHDTAVRRGDGLGTLVTAGRAVEVVQWVAGG